MQSIATKKVVKSAVMDNDNSPTSKEEKGGEVRIRDPSGDGLIDYDASRSVGSQFWFELPIALADTSETGLPLTAFQNPDGAHAHSPNLLLVEDNAMNQAVIEGFLNLRGWTCTTVSSGAEALERLEDEAFDLILMDVRMPGMDGLEVTRRIRQMSKSQTRSTPVMALTANALREEQAECLRAGMDGYVSKPIQRSAFFAEMDRLLTPDWRLANRDDLSGAA